MLLSIFFLFSLCASTVKSWNSTLWLTQYSQTEITRTTLAAEEVKLSPLQLVATPDYPVAAGQKVHLHCFASTIPNYVNWTWQQLDLNQTWKVVHSGMNLTLTKPEQSGTYRCHAMARLSESVSATHMVYIISMHATVGEKLGIAAFVLSFLALIICLATLFWLGWQRLGDTLTTSNTTAKGFPGPEKSPKGGLPKTDCEADVYMNYTSTNQAYTDLDPTNMTADNVYSCLS